jgi:hypothetical protein
MFGEWMVPSIDIDLARSEMPETGVNEDINFACLKFEHAILGDKG